MYFREVNRSKCKTYLAACERTRRAALIDPVHEHVTRYLALLAYYGFKLEALFDTHTHADHGSACAGLSELTDARIHMHESAPQPRVHVHLRDSQTVEVGDLRFSVLYTPGHTPDSISLLLGDRVMTGDTLLIGGTGRTDFAGGDAGAQYDSIVNKLFTLPDATLVFPAHDYRGHTQSTIGDERRENLRIAGRSREEYVQLMGSLDLPLPQRIQEVLQINQSEVDDDTLKFPSVAELSQVQLLQPQQLQDLLNGSRSPLVIDVREPHEYGGDLGHIPGSRLIPLRRLPGEIAELHAWRRRPVVLVCRAGVRSATAAAVMTGLGFDEVFNLQGGMLAWNRHHLAVQY